MSEKGVRYRIQVDAGAANAELARTHRAATTMAGAEREAAAATEAVNASLRQTVPAARGASGAMAQMQAASKRLSGTLGKQAAAIALLSQQLGDQNKQVGEAIRGAGQMAAAYGAGGPWALALVAGIGLVGKLSQHWDDVIQKQREAMDQRHQATDDASARVRALEEEARALELRARSAKEVRDEERAALVAQLEVAKAHRISHQVQRDVFNLTKEQKQEQGALLSLRKREEDAIRRKIAALDKMAEAQKSVGDAARKTTKQAEVIDEDNTLAGPSMTFLKNLWKEKQDARAEVLAQNEQMEREAQGRRIAWEQRVEEDHQAALQRMREETAEHYRGIAMQMAAITAGAAQQLIADLISGQDQALEKMGLRLMQEAGQALIGYGIQAFGAAALNASLQLWPLAAQQAATGAALTGAGVALGGTAVGLGNLMSGAQGNERQLPGVGMSVGTGGGGGTSVQIVYAGASGPTADHGAAAVVMAMDRGQRRQEQAGPMWR